MSALPCRRDRMKSDCSATSAGQDEQQRQQAAGDDGHEDNRHRDFRVVATGVQRRTSAIAVVAAGRAPKSMPSDLIPGWIRIFYATNAKRLRADHARE